MSKATHYVLTHESGSVTVLAAFDAHGTKGLDQFIAAQKAGNKVVTFEKIAAADIPTDRSYRDAWTFTGKFGHDMAKARNIHRDKIRAARKVAFDQLDPMFLANLIQGKEPSPDLKAARQRLLDAPAHPDIEAAQTVEQLKRAWPL